MKKIIVAALVGLVLLCTAAFAEESKTDKILMYQAEKKTPWVALVATTVFPTLGHAYASDWWPRGAKFLFFYLGSGFLMANEGIAPIATLVVIGCRVWEYVDAYNATNEFNSSLAKRYGIQLSLRDGPSLYLCYKF